MCRRNAISETKEPETGQKSWNSICDFVNTADQLAHTAFIYNVHSSPTQAQTRFGCHYSQSSRLDSQCLQSYPILMFSRSGGDWPMPRSLRMQAGSTLLKLSPNFTINLIIPHPLGTSQMISCRTIPSSSTTNGSI
jgi:hypothetical protein